MIKELFRGPTSRAAFIRGTSTLGKNRQDTKIAVDELVFFSLKCQEVLLKIMIFFPPSFTSLSQAHSVNSMEVFQAL